MSERTNAVDGLDGETVSNDEAPPPGDKREKGSSFWLLVTLVVLGLLLVWIILGIWRYLQVLGYGGA